MNYLIQIENSVIQKVRFWYLAQSPEKWNVHLSINIFLLLPISIWKKNHALQVAWYQRIFGGSLFTHQACRSQHFQCFDFSSCMVHLLTFRRAVLWSISVQPHTFGRFTNYRISLSSHRRHVKRQPSLMKVYAAAVWSVILCLIQDSQSTGVTIYLHLYSVVRDYSLLRWHKRDTWKKNSISWPRLTISWPRLTNSWPRLTNSWPRLTISWPRLTNSWPRLTNSWPRDTNSWPRLTISWPRVSYLVATTYYLVATS